LLVLVPASAFDEAALARQVWAIAESRNCEVIYLGLARDAVGEAALRRRLATLAALTRTDQQLVETCLSTARDWVAAVRAARRPADELACLAGESAFRWGRRRPLSVTLAATLRLIVHELDAGPLPAPADIHPRAAFSTGLGFVGLILVFLWFQIQAVRLPPTLAHDALLLILVVLEFALLAGWHKLNL
jgi:hypothetical protein